MDILLVVKKRQKFSPSWSLHIVCIERQKWGADGTKTKTTKTKKWNRSYMKAREEWKVGDGPGGLLRKGLLNSNRKCGSAGRRVLLRKAMAGEVLTSQGETARRPRGRREKTKGSMGDEVREVVQSQMVSRPVDVYSISQDITGGFWVTWLHFYRNYFTATLNACCKVKDRSKELASQCNEQMMVAWTRIMARVLVRSGPSLGIFEVDLLTDWKQMWKEGVKDDAK